MRTFNIDLWQTLKEKSTGLNEGAGSLLKSNIFFGIAPASQKTPYCVLHVLDSGNDVNAQTLCQNDEGYNAAGVSDIQFSVYATNDMAIDEILQELNNMIKSLQNLSEHRITNAVRQRTKNASTFTNETGQGFTEFIFKYEHL